MILFQCLTCGFFSSTIASPGSKDSNRKTLKTICPEDNLAHLLVRKQKEDNT